MFIFQLFILVIFIGLNIYNKNNCLINTHKYKYLNALNLLLFFFYFIYIFLYFYKLIFKNKKFKNKLISYQKML
jgi:uncharacterized protein HemY